MSGTISTFTPYSSFDLMPVGFRRNQWGAITNANWSKADGALSTLNAKIDTKVTDLSNLANSKLSLTGGAVTGHLSALAGITIAPNYGLVLGGADGLDPLLVLGVGSNLHYQRSTGALGINIGGATPIAVLPSYVTVNTPLHLNVGATLASHATRKDYVDAKVGEASANANGRVSRDGDTITGNLTVNGGVFTDVLRFRTDGAQDTGIQTGGDGVLNIVVNGQINTAFNGGGIYSVNYGGYLHEVFRTRTDVEFSSDHLRVTGSNNPRLILHRPGQAQWSQFVGGDGNLWITRDDGATGDNWAARFHADSAFHVRGNIVGNGTTTSVGSVYAPDFVLTSDARLKSNVRPLAGGLDTVLRLSGRSYTLDSNAGRDRDGFVAQEVQEVIPNAVIEMPNGYLGIDATALIPHLVEAIKTLAAQVEALRRA